MPFFKQRKQSYERLSDEEKGKTESDNDTECHKENTQDRGEVYKTSIKEDTEEAIGKDVARDEASASKIGDLGHNKHSAEITNKGNPNDGCFVLHNILLFFFHKELFKINFTEFLFATPALADVEKRAFLKAWFLENCCRVLKVAAIFLTYISLVQLTFKSMNTLFLWKSDL